MIAPADVPAGRYTVHARTLGGPVDLTLEAQAGASYTIWCNQRQVNCVVEARGP